MSEPTKCKCPDCKCQGCTCNQCTYNDNKKDCKKSPSTNSIKLKNTDSKPNDTDSKPNENFVSLKEIRTELYKLREFEISNLWQRSLLLSALIVLSFTGYGFMAMELVKDTNNSNTVVINTHNGSITSGLVTESSDNSIQINIICIGIAILGFILSTIWTMMAKGSKAWYEVYEEKIKDIEKHSTLGIKSKYTYDNVFSLTDLDHNLLTTNPGGYSVSKINITIGKVTSTIWGIIYFFHIILICFFIKNTFPNIKDKITVFILAFIITLIIMPPIISHIEDSARSKKLK